MLRRAISSGSRLAALCTPRLCQAASPVHPLLEAFSLAFSTSRQGFAHANRSSNVHSISSRILSTQSWVNHNTRAISSPLFAHRRRNPLHSKFYVAINLKYIYSIQTQSLVLRGERQPPGVRTSRSPMRGSISEHPDRLVDLVLACFAHQGTMLPCYAAPSELTLPKATQASRGTLQQ